MINNLKDTEELEKFFGFRPILSASVKVTRNCNLNCRHCYVNTNNGVQNMQINQIKNIINQIADCGCINLFINRRRAFFTRRYYRYI